MTEAKDDTSPDRYVLLGASNLTLSFPLLLQNLLAEETTSVDVHAALGHGRSFLGWSYVLWRGLPGIIDCRLWEDVTAGHDAASSTRALITDVGNDLLYGYPVNQITAAVAECLQRLQRHEAEIVLTLPPLASVRKLSRWRFSLVRRVLFPACRLSFHEVLTAAHQLEEQLAELGRQQDLPVIVPPAEWYGFDPIHLRRSCRSAAWREILSAWRDFTTANWQPLPSSNWKRLFRNSRPAQYQWRRRNLTESQPTIQTPSGKLSLY